MRSLDYLIQLFPDKTGKELLEIRNQDKQEDADEFKKIHANKLAIIEDINTNGGFYKGKFGLDQHFYYSFSNMHLIKDNIYCDVNEVVAFFELVNNKTSIENRKQALQSFENYGVNMYERVTKEEFDKAVAYLESFKDFWK